MKILITGGHLAPAIALIEELQGKKNLEIVFVGRKYAFDSENTISLEYREIEKLGIPFVPLTAGRLTRVLTLKSVRNVLRIPIGFLNALSIIKIQRPDVIFSFGGFLALPIAFWGKFFKIPVYSHEQTVNPGLANRLIARFSKKIYVAFPDAKKLFDPAKTFVSGNPVRKAVYRVEKTPFEIKKDRPVIYVTGGTLGSHSINIHIKKILGELLENYIVIHQTGDTKEYHDYEDLSELRNLLPEDKKNRYFPKKHFFMNEVGYVYSLTDLCVGRSGANTFFELISLKIPAILIPLPWSSGREQQKHAEIFVRSGLGEIFHQVEPSGKLLRLVETTMKNLGTYKNNFEKLDFSFKRNAAKYLAGEILG